VEIKLDSGSSTLDRCRRGLPSKIQCLQKVIFIAGDSQKLSVCKK